MGLAAFPSSVQLWFRIFFIFQIPASTGWGEFPSISLISPLRMGRCAALIWALVLRAIDLNPCLATFSELDAPYFQGWNRQVVRPRRNIPNGGIAGCHGLEL